MSRKLSIFFVCLYGSLVLIFSVLLFALPKKDFSPTENRTLSGFPRFSPQSVLDGSYMEKFSSFCADGFPFRSFFLTLDSSRELALGKLEADGVMLGRDGNLIKRLEYNDASLLKSNLNRIEELRLFVEGKGADSVFFCAPRGVDVLADFCPFPFDGTRCADAWEELGEAVTATEELREKAASGEYVFYKTDHHWTTLGAYYAYAALGKELGYSPLPLTEFTVEIVSDSFLGTTYSAALIPSTTPDSIIAMRYENDEGIKVTDISTGKVGGLYDYSALNGSSKYDFFLGGNKARLRVESGKKPKLIIIKDSFANSLIPFLARHFDMEVIDPRYLRQPLEKVLEELYGEGDPPTLLFFFGLDSLNGKIGL